MKSRVFFIKTDQADSLEILQQKTAKILEASHILDGIEKKDFVCCKLTFGEKENTGFIKPQIIKTIVDKLNAKGCRPFMLDTNTLYEGSRRNAIDHLNLAREHGFTHEAVGAPVIIGDGLLGRDCKDVEINKEYFKSVKIASFAQSADAIIGISHFKGHMLSGFGGAIKNLGMGMAAKAGKLSQHSTVKPQVINDKCTGCEKCILVCPVKAIIMDGEKAKIKEKVCIGCGDCLVVCRFEAISISWSETSKNLQEKMVEYAYGAIKDKKHIGFLNFVYHVTKECDCLAKDDPAIVPDMGILASLDPVALDKASVDLIMKRTGEDDFKKAHPDTDWKHQLLYGQRIGLGKLDYQLQEVK